MKVGWLVDHSDMPGGAEFTQGEFRRSAPDGVEIVTCLPGEPWDTAGCDQFVIQNCVLYSLDDLKKCEGKPVTKYWHDVGPWLADGVRKWLDKHATPICCSPVQAEYMGLQGAHCIPPPINYAPFTEAAASVNGNRKGAVCIGSWRNWGKAPHKAGEWAREQGLTIDFFGGGPIAPRGSLEVPYQDIPPLLASYETFVFLPSVIEPFGRLVAEAYASGCEVVTNNLVGAKWWIENDQLALEGAAERFWEVVLDG
jgi:glycosyltransferase involved in cell wall biosynthesis